MKLYFDTCCWNRPYDEHSQKKVYDEAVAIMRIIRQSRRRNITILGSVTLIDEIGETGDAEKFVWITNLYKGAVTARANYNKGIFDKWEPLAETAGISGWDIYHLCYAESSGADYLLTTDKDFIKGAATLNTAVKVINPLNFPIGGIL